MNLLKNLVLVARCASQTKIAVMLAAVLFAVSIGGCDFFSEKLPGHEGKKEYLVLIEKMRTIRQGMTKDEVKGILGEPEIITYTRDGHVRWAYDAPAIVSESPHVIFHKKDGIVISVKIRST